MNILIFLIILLNSIYCFADRVCIEKSTNKLIEYQSGDAPLGALTKNAQNAGYKKEDVEEKYITNNEWLIIKKKQIDDPIEKARQEKEKIRKQKEETIKTKLGLSQEDFKDLKEALND